MPNILEHDEILYAKAIVGEELTPGCVTVSATRTYNYEIKKADGKSGATTEFKGRDIASVTMTFELADAEDFADWEAFSSKIVAGAEANPPKAWATYHPELVLVNVATIVLLEVGTIEYNGKGGGKVTTKWSEYAPPKPAGGSPQKKGKLAPGSADQNADVKKQIQDLVDEAKKL